MADNSETPQQPSTPLRRSLVYIGGSAFSPGLPARTMKYDEWMALLGGEKAAQEVIDAGSLYRWGQPYKDQSGPDEEEG
jgi:hypothetical protein